MNNSDMFTAERKVGAKKTKQKRQNTLHLSFLFHVVLHKKFIHWHTSILTKEVIQHEACSTSLARSGEGKALNRHTSGKNKATITVNTWSSGGHEPNAEDSRSRLRRHQLSRKHKEMVAAFSLTSLAKISRKRGQQEEDQEETGPHHELQTSPCNRELQQNQATGFQRSSRLW